MSDLDREWREVHVQIEALRAKALEIEAAQRELGKVKCSNCDQWAYVVFKEQMFGDQLCIDCKCRLDRIEADAEERRRLEYHGEVLLDHYKNSEPGCVYVLFDARYKHYKIGATNASLVKRIGKYAQTRADDVSLVMAFLSYSPFNFEKFLHFRFDAKRLSNREWFSLDSKDFDLLWRIESEKLFTAYQPLHLVREVHEAEEWIKAQRKLATAGALAGETTT
jgi:ssDNA-binding Zn-finger/Zn-ribbon topoisomerase 1